MEFKAVAKNSSDSITRLLCDTLSNAMIQRESVGMASELGRCRARKAHGRHNREIELSVLLSRE